jgi:hypothetical protein
MKRLITLSALSLLWSFSMFAQKADTAKTLGGVNEVYYSFTNGEVKSIDNNTWDIAFEMKGFLSGILVNEQAGAELYLTPYAIADWANFDTANLSSWERSYNSNETWSQGAFNSHINGEFDLGWGLYDINTHGVLGDSIYLLKTRDGNWKKIYIKSLASSTYTFVYANVDGSGELTKTIVKSEFPGVNFAYYDFRLDASLNREPESKDWDIVFTKYLMPIPQGPITVYYPVGGVKINKDYENAQRNNELVMSNDTMGLTWNTDITEIGSDWKSFDGMKYVFAQDQAYFVRTSKGAVWKIYFTNYVGGTAADYYFNTELIAASASLPEFNYQVGVYPNPMIGSFSVASERPINSIELIDLKGTLVRTWMNSNEGDVSGIASGLYFLKVRSGDYSHSTKVHIR